VLDFTPFGIKTLAARAKCLDFVRAPVGMRAETEARSSHNTIVRCGLVTTVTYSRGLQHAQPQDLDRDVTGLYDKATGSIQHIVGDSIARMSCGRRKFLRRELNPAAGDCRG
jgi:predicted site-specific integrase-resolvase